MLGDGGLEGVVDVAEPVAEDVGEADQNRQADAAELQASTSSLRSMARDGSLVGWTCTWPAVDREVALAPAGTSYSSLASCTLHLRAVDPLGSMAMVVRWWPCS